MPVNDEERRPPEHVPPALTISERLRGAPVTYALTAINVAVFVYVEYFGGGTTNEHTLLRFGALEPIHIWAGEYWRFLTPMFLHIGIVHLAVNSYMSLGWSPQLERALGHARFLFLYLASGIGGSFFSVITDFALSPSIGAGASGALFGVVGAWLAPRRRNLPDWRAFAADPGVRSIVIQFALFTAAAVVLHFGIGNAAHVGGLVTGAVIATLFTAQRPRALAAVTIAVYVALAAFAARPWWTPTGALADYATNRAAKHLLIQAPAPSDLASGTRIATKACDRGVGSACGILAEYLFRTADPANTEKARQLEERGCQLDPQSCEQRH